MLSHRTLTVSSEAIPMFLGRPALEPVRLGGHENVNSLFEYELLLKTPETLDLGASGAMDFDLDAFIGREISCVIQLDGMGAFVPGSVGLGTDGVGAGTRQINALITEARLWGEEGRHVQYELTLRPWLHRAKRNVGSRIHQNKTVVQILDDLLADYAFPVDKRLARSYPTRDYQVQFNESDHAFFERLTQENGISYFFEHGEGKHRLVLVDETDGCGRNPSEAYQEVEYHPPGWKTDAEYISRFVPHHRLTSGRYTTRDYDYRRPRADLTVGHKDPRPTGQADGEVYQWHDPVAGAHYAQPGAGTADANDPHAEGRDIARLRMQALRTHGARATGSGNLRGMVPGCTFKLARHPRQKANVDYLILETRFLIEDVGQDSQIRDAAPGRRQQWKVEVDFTAHPVKEPLRPALIRPKPLTHGVQVALVVGPADQEIWTDDLGRVKVQFPWDRIGGKDQHSSCWIRAMLESAGNQRGAIHVPRIGQELVIGFVGGDPDLPICLGSVSNQNNLPPWELPGQSALSGFRSRELTKGGGNGAAGRSNHLVLDDTPGKIQAQLKSDHLCSSLSLGYVVRIEDNAGRKDERGEGFELGTGGSGALRADKGLLLSTDGRSQAVGGILSRDELVTCLRQALTLAEDLAKSAVDSQATPRETTPQQDLGAAVEALGHGANNERDAKGRVPGGQPVIALSGAGGIAIATPKDHTQYAGENIDAVAGWNLQHYAGRSLLQSAGRDIEQFTASGDIRSIANQGKVIQQAQHNSVEITGQKDVIVTSTEEGVVIRAKKTITLMTDDGTYLRIGDGQVTFGMTGSFIVKAANFGTQGPSTLSTDLPHFPETGGFNDAFVVMDPQSSNPLANMRYRIVHLDGGTFEGVTGADGRIPLQKGVSPDSVDVHMLGIQP